MRLQGCLFEPLGKFGGRVVEILDIPWDLDAIERRLPLVVSGAKDRMQLFSGGVYTLGSGRGLANLEGLHVVVLDADCTDVGTFDTVCDYLHARGSAFWAYTSWSHRNPAKTHKGSGRTQAFDCFRVVLPLSRVVTPDEFRALVPGLMGFEVPADPAHYYTEVHDRWMAAGGRERMAAPRGWDTCNNRPAQAYYVPGCPPERAVDALQDFAAGAPVDVDAVLARPTTHAVRLGRQREYTQPTEAAIGTLSDIVDALMEAGHHVSSPNHGGWRRTACPSCAPGGHQKSPSCTIRANGEWVDVHCHAGCRREEILTALALDTNGRFREPGVLENRLTDQLTRQVPHRPAVPVSLAVDMLEADIFDAAMSRTPTIVNYPCGSGKSYAAAKAIVRLVAAGHDVLYVTQEHRVAAETRRYLPMALQDQSVHLHSPLVAVEGEAVCRRADEVRPLVFEHGVSLRRNVCPTCPFRDTCSAIASADARSKRKDAARVVFASHAGIGQALGDANGAARMLIVDEMPSVFEAVTVEADALAEIAARAPLPEAFPEPAKAAYAIARGWLAGTPPEPIQRAPGVVADPLSVAAEWRRLVLMSKAPPIASERPKYLAADAIVRLGAHLHAGGKVFGLEDRGARGVTAMLPDACHAALTARGGVLLSATPMTAALGGFTEKLVEVTDASPVRRVVLLRQGRGSGALTKSYPDGRGGREIRSPRPGEAPGIPWDVVSAALDRAAAETTPYACKRVLFVSFKKVIDALRSRPDLLRGRPFELAYFGALRGKNDWQVGGAREVSVVYCLGTPRFAVEQTLASLGVVGEARQLAWADYAAGELAQAEGRLRLPRRTKPCTVVVEGDVVPATWHTGHDIEVDMGLSEDSVD